MSTPTRKSFAPRARVVVLEVGENLQNVLSAVERDLATLVAEVFPIGIQNDVASTSCTLPRRSWALRLVTTQT